MAGNAPANSNAGLAAGLQQPQTTIEPPGGPFIRHSQPGRRPIYNLSGLPYLTTGNIVTQPVVAVPGYYRGFRMTFQASGGSGGSAQTVNADAPYSIASLVTLKDAFGTPIIVAPGYEAFFLIPLYGGQFGFQGTRYVSNLPSFAAFTAASYNFTFSTLLPFEFSKGYGVVSGANASLLPTLTMNLNSGTGLATGGTAPTGSTLAVQCDADYYWLPEGVAVEPPGLGTTMQWIYQQCNPTFGSGSTTTVQLPRLGGYLAAIILELRDSTGARVDAWPTGLNRLRIIVDGVPLIDSSMNEIFDDMAIQFGIGDNSSVIANVPRPVGTICITRRTALGQVDFGLFDSGETYLSTNPGTLIEIQGTPWGSGGTPPYTMSVIAAQVVPAGTLIQGLPEV